MSGKSLSVSEISVSVSEISVSVSETSVSVSEISVSSQFFLQTKFIFMKFCFQPLWHVGVFNLWHQHSHIEGQQNSCSYAQWCCKWVSAAV